MKKIKLSPEERQFILYAKKHFKHTEPMEDIKVFSARMYRYPVNCAEPRNVWYFVIQVYEKLINAEYIRTGGLSSTSYIFQKIVERDLKRDDGSLLQFILSDIRNIYVKGLDLEEADSSYLELK